MIAEARQTCPPPGLVRRELRALGTDVELLLASPGEEELLGEAERELERLEDVFSRFRPHSELSRLNRRGAGVVSEELAEVIELALAARRETGGRFDPTVHDALVAAGYDRTFEELPPDAPGRGPVPCGGRIELDRAGRHVRLAVGTAIDLGGIAKGWIVDRLCDRLGEAGPCLVNAGGDLAVRGLLEGDPWPVAVEGAGEPFVVAVASGALATSGTDRRRWRQRGRERHHVIDPRTGEPAVTDLLRVTVAAPAAATAEVWAKALLVAGESSAAAEATEHEISCILVTADGRVRLEGGLA